MTALRQRMIENLKLGGYSERTQQAYVSSVRLLAEYYGKSPDLITEEQLRHYFLHLKDERKLARSPITIALCGIKLFDQRTLGRDWGLFDSCAAAREELPVVLSRNEVRQILARIRIPVYRVCLTTIYGCGLRLMEGACLQPSDVDSARMLLHVRGKGERDRLVPLQKRTLLQLREHWCTHRSPDWLFPAPTRRGLAHSLAHGGGPLTRSSLQSALRRAVQKSGVKKRAHVHTLRHCYATHLLEAGVDLRVIQGYLGHASPKTTSVYMHLTTEVRQASRDPIERLTDGL